MTVFVVAYGDPSNGYKLHGPFPTAEAAGDWGEEMGEGGEFVMEVHPITEDSCSSLYTYAYPVFAAQEQPK